MTDLLLVDDHHIVLRGLCATLSEAPGLSVAAEATTGEEALRLARGQRFDAIVLDLGLPDVDGLEVLRRLHAEQPKLPILILSTHPEESYAIPLLQAGAAGYLVKTQAPMRIVEAVRTIAEGRRFIGERAAQAMAARLVQASGGEAGPSVAMLSERELQVLRLIAEGKLREEIAEILAVSPKTVSTYRTRVLEKLGFRTDADLTRYAMRQGIVR